MPCSASAKNKSHMKNRLAFFGGGQGPECQCHSVLGHMSAPFVSFCAGDGIF